MLGFIIGAVRLGATFLLGSTGEIITQKSGHLNLGIPGVMCVGAAFGCFSESIYVSSLNGGTINPVLAVLIPILCALIGSALMGLLYSFLTVTLHANQNVTGLALTTFGVGLTNYVISLIKDTSTFSRASKYFTNLIPGTDDMGFLRLFFSYGPTVYLAIIIAVVASYVLKSTRVGLHLRAVGENPATADAMGINVTLYRYTATCIGCGIAGLGGLFFIMDSLYGYWEYAIDDMGWLAVALVIFAVWRPNISIIGSIIFGALYIAPNHIKGVSFVETGFLKMLPYVVTIVVLIVTSIRNKKENYPPAGLGLNYSREER
ncbi:MAG: ABC transporter permease [Clostridia bacterium]|nr:ABC transporter permease [Clostridia bacterium]